MTAQKQVFVYTVALFLALICASRSAFGQPVITQQPTNAVVTLGDTVNFSVAVSGAGPFTYQWLWNGTNIVLNDYFITTVAGNSGSGYSGDGGLATNANLSNPNSVAVDTSGNVFIADQNNNRIRKVSINGIIEVTLFFQAR